MFSIPQKKILTTKSDFKTSALSFQIESKCFQYLKKRSLRQNPSSKHPLYHFKSSPNVFNTSKKDPYDKIRLQNYHFKSSTNVFNTSKQDPYDKIRLQNIRFIISNRVQMFSIPQKKILTTKSVLKTSTLSFKIESKCFQYLKKNPYDKIRLQNIRFIISNRVQMFSIPQNKILTTKSVFKTSALSFQIESKCFQYLKKRSLLQNPSSKHPLYHFKSSPNVFNTSKKDPYDKIRLQNIRFIISNPALSFQIESKCFQY